MSCTEVTVWKGLSRLDQVVRRGDVLALVEQAVSHADRTTLSERRKWVVERSDQLDGMDGRHRSRTA